MSVLLDTCALVYWTLDPSKLSQKASNVIGQKDTEKYISSISIWEIGIKVIRKKLVIPMSPDDYLAMVKQIEGLAIVPVDENIWLANLKLEWEHTDPADRTIVATARILKSSLITSDKIIRSFYKNTIW